MSFRVESAPKAGRSCRSCQHESKSIAANSLCICPRKGQWYHHDCFLPAMNAKPRRTVDYAFNDMEGISDLRVQDHEDVKEMFDKFVWSSKPRAKKPKESGSDSESDKSAKKSKSSKQESDKPAKKSKSSKQEADKPAKKSESSKQDKSSNDKPKKSKDDKVKKSKEDKPKTSKSSKDKSSKDKSPKDKSKKRKRDDSEEPPKKKKKKSDGSAEVYVEAVDTETEDVRVEDVQVQDVEVEDVQIAEDTQPSGDVETAVEEIAIQGAEAQVFASQPDAQITQSDSMDTSQ